MSVEKELQELGVKPVEGQNFLNSEVIVKALVEAGEVEDQRVLDIGAGTGVITGELAERAEKVYAVENDARLAGKLREKFSDVENVEVTEDDILNHDIPEVDRCVSNLPFQISSEILELLGEKQVQSSLILQEELADRIVADPGDSGYGSFTVMISYYFVPVKLREVGRRNYYPQPDVDTAIVKLYPNRERHGIEDEENFFLMTRALFTNKRKKVRNAFVDSRHILEIDKDKAKRLRDELPHSEERVVNLDIRQIAEIADFYSRNKSR